MKRTMLIVITAAVMALAGSVTAQEAPEPPEPAGSSGSRSGYMSVGLAGGLMVDPDMNAGMISLDYYITDEIAVGPYVHVGGGADNSYWGLSGQIKFCPQLAGNSSIRPYGFAGIGFVELDFEDRDDDPSYTYLFPVGGGIEFEINDSVSLDASGVFEITEDIFVGLLFGVRVLL